MISRGLWRDGNYLVVARDGAEFPESCLWTNASSDIEHKVLRFAFAVGGNFHESRPGKFKSRGRVLECSLAVPVWSSAKKKQSARIARVGKVLRWTSAFLILGGIIALLWVDEAMGGIPSSGFSLATVPMIVIGLGVPFLLIGLAWPFLDFPSVDDKYARPAAFIDDEYVWIMGVHREFLAALPPWDGEPLKSKVGRARKEHSPAITVGGVLLGIAFLLWIAYKAFRIASQN